MIIYPVGEERVGMASATDGVTALVRVPRASRVRAVARWMVTALMRQKWRPFSRILAIVIRAHCYLGEAVYIYF